MKAWRKYIRTICCARQIVVVRNEHTVGVINGSLAAIQNAIFRHCEATQKSSSPTNAKSSSDRNLHEKANSF